MSVQNCTASQHRKPPKTPQPNSQLGYIFSLGRNAVTTQI